MNKYRDKREGFFRDSFSRALSYEAYVSGSSYQSRWRAIEAEVEKLTIPSSISTMIRKMPVIVLSGDWCGDCSRQGPQFNKIQKENPIFEFRFAESSVFPHLKEELRISGAERVPVVVAFNEDFHEVARFGDRHLSVYRSKQMKELGVACDPGILPPEKSALQAEFEEWVAFFERLQILLRLAPGLRKKHGD